MQMQKIKKFLAKALLVISLSFIVTPIAAPIANIPVVSTVQAATYNKATIKNVQKALNKLGYDCGTPDGIMGKKTKAAIKDYQKDKDLKVTGTVNKTLLKSLGVKASTSTASDTKKKETTVYVTKTGSKYHKGSCRYLRQSKISISLSEAKKYYDPCSVCKP